jgi:hypothetical protein
MDLFSFIKLFKSSFVMPCKTTAKGSNKHASINETPSGIFNKFQDLTFKNSENAPLHLDP